MKKITQVALVSLLSMNLVSCNQATADTPLTAQVPSSTEQNTSPQQSERNPRILHMPEFQLKNVQSIALVGQSAADQKASRLKDETLNELLQTKRDILEPLRHIVDQLNMHYLESSDGATTCSELKEKLAQGSINIQVEHSNAQGESEVFPVTVGIGEKDDKIMENASYDVFISAVVNSHNEETSFRIDIDCSSANPKGEIEFRTRKIDHENIEANTYALSSYFYLNRDSLNNITITQADLSITDPKGATNENSSVSYMQYTRVTQSEDISLRSTRVENYSAQVKEARYTPTVPHAQGVFGQRVWLKTGGSKTSTSMKLYASETQIITGEEALEDGKRPAVSPICLAADYNTIGKADCSRLYVREDYESAMLLNSEEFFSLEIPYGKWAFLANE